MASLLHGAHVSRVLRKLQMDMHVDLAARRSASAKIRLAAVSLLRRPLLFQALRTRGNSCMLEYFDTWMQHMLHPSVGDTQFNALN